MGLHVADLSCARAGRPVLRGLDLELAAGEVLMVRGPNGAGKSTLLRALAGLLPSTGRIALDGRTLAGTPDAWAEQVAYAGHLDAVKPQLTVAENLGFWAALFGGADAGAALDAFDLAPLADRPAHLLSAGQKRRLGLARILLVPRRLWLLDEPTVALDAASVARLEAVVARHAAAGGMAVIATHAGLDLPARELTLAPEAPTTRGATDPFLAGSWS
jgi:heme exporter protein A